jgi:hypothetical protein
MPALEVLGTADVLTHFARGHPEDLQTLRLVSLVLLPAVHQAALAVLVEAKTSFEHLMSSLPTVRLEELRELDFFFDTELDDDNELMESWESAERSYAEATRQLQAHQAVILRAQHLLEQQITCIGFEPQARALVHAGALTLLNCAFDADMVLGSIDVGNFPEDDLEISNHPEWWDNEAPFWVQGPIRELVDEEQKYADQRAMRARFGMGAPRLDGFMDHAWLLTAARVAARERAGLAAPVGCCTLEQLANEAPRELDRVRTAEWRLRHRLDAKARKLSWLALGLWQLGVEVRTDSVRQKECVAATYHSMEGQVGETLRSAVWMHWLHNCTQGRYRQAVHDLVYVIEYSDDEDDVNLDLGDGGGPVRLHRMRRPNVPDGPAEDASPRAYHIRSPDDPAEVGLPRCGHARYTGMEFREAVDLIQPRPEFQMPDTIPWLPAPGNNTEEAILDATRAVRVCIRWGRAFLRVRAIVALCRPSSSAAPTA